MCGGVDGKVRVLIVLKVIDIFIFTLLTLYYSNPLYPPNGLNSLYTTFDSKLVNVSFNVGINRNSWFAAWLSTPKTQHFRLQNVPQLSRHRVHRRRAVSLFEHQPHCFKGSSDLLGIESFFPRNCHTVSSCAVSPHCGRGTRSAR